MENQLTDREADIMRILWGRGPSTVNEVRAALDDTLAYTTVQTILRILEEKGFAAHEDQGRQHRFHALVAESTARRNALQHLVGKLFRGSSELLFTQLVSDTELTPEQVRRLKRLLAGGSKE